MWSLCPKKLRGTGFQLCLLSEPMQQLLESQGSGVNMNEARNVPS